MSKSEVYSWRLSPELKAALERAARREERSLSELLEAIARRFLEETSPERDLERARAAARRTFGAIAGDRSDRAERARELVRSKLAKRRAR